MPTSYRVLGQVNPAATTSTNLVTVTSTASSYVVVSSISIANLASSSATYRIAVRPNAETLANKHYLAYDVTVGAADTTILTVGLTLDTSDVIDVYASTANLVFHAYGSEIS
jgi:glucose-6-phosphate dehydrogenase assembly protein OpcA